MKKLLLIALLFVSLNSFSQSDSVKYVYCEIVGTQKLLSNKVTIEIDYGQFVRYGETSKVKDENGKAKTFNSMVDALNYMGSKGWEFAQAYVVSVSANQSVYHFLLKRRI